VIVATLVVLLASTASVPAGAAPGVVPEGRIVVSQVLPYDDPDGCAKSPCGWHRIWQGAAGGAFTQLANLGRGESYGGYFAPVLSPDGQWLAYPTRAGRVGLVQVDLDSGTLVGGPLFLGAFAVAPTAVAWSPDGSRLVLMQGFANKGVWVVARDGTGARKVARGARIDVFSGYGVSWSASGIAFAGQSHGRSAILVVQPDGSGLHRLTRPHRSQDDAQPVWSPDASTIAFVRNGDGYQYGGAVELVSGRGGTPHRIARDGTAPAFSPDGRFIAYVRPGDVYDTPTRLGIFDSAARHATSVGLPNRLAAFGYPDGLNWLP
jgi:dipeptidyl aminopeptidase/acylaminoacyl peptidase